MKVLQVNVVYKNGSTGKITADIHTQLLKNGIESVVCYGRGSKVDEPYVYKTCGELYAKMNNAFSRITGIMYAGCLFSTRKLINIIKREKPDIVHLQCINGYFVNIYKLVTWLKKNKINTILTLHAEFMYTGGCGHAFDCEQWRKQSGICCTDCPRWKKETKSIFFSRTSTMWKKMKKAFDGFDKDKLTIVSVSPWLMDRAKSSQIFRNYNHKVIYNGLDTSVFKLYDTTEVKKKYNLTDEKIIFHATPSFSDDPNNIKGGCYVIDLAKRMINDNVKIFVAGNYKKGMNLPKNIILLGRIKDQVELAKLYSMADVTVLTSKKETFSMVVAESLCCGTPVVGFKAGGPEQIAIKEYSQFVEYGDVELLEKHVKNFIDCFLNKKNISEASRNCYSKKTMCNNYLYIYKEILKS